SYTGVFEMCETNLLDFTVKEAEIHRFYHKKLEKLGIDRLTCENAQEIPNCAEGKQLEIQKERPISDLKVQLNTIQQRMKPGLK
ncbi:hypothetical protein N4844_16205, partial [Enterococcus faecalis]|nr:hypothetical protein [Enterococcus faecalis]